jgi:hypothetical protein
VKTFRITVGGLCMLVHDAKEKSLHVLAPRAGHTEHGHGHPAHEAWCVFDQRTRVAPVRLRADLDLRGTRLRAPELLECIVDVGRVIGRGIKVPRADVDNSSAHATRVSVTGGEVTAHMVKHFTLPPDPRTKVELAGFAEWSVDVDDAVNWRQVVQPLQAAAPDLTNDQANALITQHNLWIGIANIPTGARAPESTQAIADDGTAEPHHFEAFYAFWPAETPGRPKRAPGGSAPPPSNPSGLPRIPGPCMVSGAHAEP